MSLFSIFRKASQQPGGSARFQAFHRSYLSESTDVEQIRSGLEPGVIEALTPEERVQAERLLLARLARGGDSRAAVGLGLMRSQAAVEPLRQAMMEQAGRRPHASPAYADALWRIAGDPRAIEAVAAIAREPAVHETWRVDAVIALAGMPTPLALQTLQALLQAAPEYLVRYHSFKGLLKLHGYGPKEADDLAGPIAPQIAGAHVRPAARQAVLARLAELLAGRAMDEGSGA